MRETVHIYISHRVDIWMAGKIKSWHFSKGRVLTLDQSIQGRLGVGNELDLKMWVKFRHKRLDRRKPKIPPRTMWASMDRVGQSGECSQGRGRV